VLSWRHSHDIADQSGVHDARCIGRGRHGRSMIVGHAQDPRPGVGAFEDSCTARRHIGSTTWSKCGQATPTRRPPGSGDVPQPLAAMAVEIERSCAPVTLAVTAMVEHGFDIAESDDTSSNATLNRRYSAAHYLPHDG
jgi:hypothetical protein